MKSINLPSKQSFNLPRMKHESLIIPIIPSTSASSFGSYFSLDLKEKNILLHNLYIQFNVPAVVRTGTLVGTDIRFIPACFWMNRIELCIGGAVIDTIYPLNNFIHQQLFNLDSTRKMINDSQGNYSSASQRVALTNATSDYYVDLYFIIIIIMFCIIISIIIFISFISSSFGVSVFSIIIVSIIVIMSVINIIIIIIIICCYSLWYYCY